MAKFTQVPSDVDAKLKENLNNRYPDLKKTNKNISYSESKSHNVRYIAEVTYFFEKTSSTAMFEYKGDRNGYNCFWYCTNDWND